MEIRNLNTAVTSLPSLTPSEAPRPASADADSVDLALQRAAVARAAEARAENEARQAPDERQLQDSVNMVNEAVKVFNSSVRFSIDEETKQRVVRVVDLETDEVIRQIPSEEVLAIAKAFDKLQGLLIKDKA